MSTLAHHRAGAEHGRPCHSRCAPIGPSRRTSRARLRLGHAHSSLVILFSNARRSRSLMGRAVTTYARPFEVGASVTTTRNRLASGVPLEFSATEPVLVRDHNEYRP